MSRPLPSQIGRPLVIAHRGAKAYKPENTLAAFALAVEQGADMIETDLHLASDQTVPISHDASLERFDREGEISQFSLEELRVIALQAHASSGEAGPHEGIPTLAEMLDAFGSVLPFNLEIKTDTRYRPYPGLQKMALDHVRERGILEQTLFSSFSDEALAEIRTLEPTARLGVLEDAMDPGGIFERAASVGAESVNPHFINATKDLVDEAHDLGLAVFVYTVDEEDRMRSLFDIGVDGIFSNTPDRLRAVVDSL